MNSNNDGITNWYTKLPKHLKDTAKDSTFSTHLIKPNSMVVVSGQTGSGKTNAIVEFLSRKKNQFYEIIVFTGGSKDEPLYQFLNGHIDGIKMIDEVGELPLIDNYKKSSDKKQEKLIIFDDAIMEDPRVLKQICKWYIMARKFGFTCMFLAQNYHSIPQIIRRNAHYLILFKQSDMRDVNNILTHHTMDINLEKLKAMLSHATKEPLNFLTIAVNDPTETKYRHNFTKILNPNEF